MFDFHSHILPSIDDGSSSVQESVEMLNMYSSRITDICLTPHFYPHSDDPERFWTRRAEAAERLNTTLRDKTHPVFHLGAEVAYYEGIHRNPIVERFVVEGTRLILIEMPFRTWSKRMIDELLELNRNWGIRPVLAHIDRYDFGGGENRSFLSYFLENRGLVQVNCEAFLSFWSKRRAISMIRNHMIHFIGSDAHNTTTRKPNMDKVLDILATPRTADIPDRIRENETHYMK